jgi:hypothetical protein
MRRRQEAVRLLHAKGPDFLSNHLPEGPFRALEDFCSRRDEAIRATAGAATALKEKPPSARCACDSPASSVMNQPFLSHPRLPVPNGLRRKMPRSTIRLPQDPKPKIWTIVQIFGRSRRRGIVWLGSINLWIGHSQSGAFLR